MNRKCICRNVNSPCSMGCTNMTSFKQLTSIMECMAISKPLNTNVPRPNTETEITGCRVNVQFVVQFRRETVGFIVYNRQFSRRPRSARSNSIRVYEYMPKIGIIRPDIFEEKGGNKRTCRISDLKHGISRVSSSNIVMSIDTKFVLQ